MKKIAEDYYAELKTEYSVKIRQLVPRYDDMTRCITEILELCSPETVLDIGAGVGNLSQIILQNLPRVRVTAVDACEEMVSDARRLLQHAGDRITLLHTDILDFSPEGKFDAVLSNLVLHNMSPDQKSRLLRAIRQWLTPGGAFIWGDLIRYADCRVQEHFIRQRMSFAVAAGCPRDLVKENFEKEERADHPLTVEQTLRVARSVGFPDPQNVWIHDTFAVFLLRTEKP